MESLQARRQVETWILPLQSQRPEQVLSGLSQCTDFILYESELAQRRTLDTSQSVQELDPCVYADVVRNTHNLERA